MQTVLRTINTGTIYRNLVKDEFNAKGYAILGTGKPIYRIYENAKLIAETSELYDAYLLWRFKTNTPDKSQFNYANGKMLLIWNSRAYKTEKYLGVFNNLLDLTKSVYNKLDVFIKKNTNKEDAVLKMMDFFLDTLNLKEGSAINELSYLKVQEITINSFFYRTNKSRLRGIFNNIL